MLTLERTGGTRITYDVNGDGPAIVLTHSFLFDHSMWRHQLPALHDEGWRVVNVDLRGHGKSTPVRRPFTIDDLADDVVAVLDAADADEAVWCGHSIGGMLSLRAAVRHPERVRALVLANTTAGLEDRIARIRYRVLARWNQLFGFAGDPVAGDPTAFRPDRTARPARACHRVGTAVGPDGPPKRAPVYPRARHPGRHPRPAALNRRAEPGAHRRRRRGTTPRQITGDCEHAP
jgi:pimeloyl-ACP methyl ester carboxylesterase